MDPLVLVAIALLVLGVIGSVLPILPSGIFSLVGVLLYWFQTGTPGPILFAILVGLAILATAVDWLAGFIGAKIGGVDTKTAIVAGIVGLLLLIPAGPIGLIAGVAAVVFVAELLKNDDVEASAKHAAYATVGVLASAVMQALLTVIILLAVLWVQFG